MSVEYRVCSLSLSRTHRPNSDINKRGYSAIADGFLKAATCCSRIISNMLYRRSVTSSILNKGTRKDQSTLISITLYSIKKLLSSNYTWKLRRKQNLKYLKLSIDITGQILTSHVRPEITFASYQEFSTGGKILENTRMLNWCI